MPNSNAPESKARVEKLIAELKEADHRKMLRTWLDHWWAEVVYDIETTSATISDDVTYRFYGSGLFGPNASMDSRAEARRSYQWLFDQGLMPGSPFDDERFAFGSWGLTMEALFTAVFPGFMIPGVPRKLDPEQLYLIRWRMVNVHPFTDDRTQMKGEIMYADVPTTIEPADRATISKLLGRKI